MMKRSSQFYIPVVEYWQTAGKACRLSAVLYVDPVTQKLKIAKNNLLNKIGIYIAGRFFTETVFAYNARMLEQLEQSLRQERFMKNPDMQGYEVDMKGYLEDAGDHNQGKVCRLKLRELPHAILDIIDSMWRKPESLATATMSDKKCWEVFPEVVEAIDSIFLDNCIDLWNKLRAAENPVTRVLSQDEFLSFFTAFYKISILYGAPGELSHKPKRKLLEGKHRQAAMAALQKIQEAGLVKVAGNDMVEMPERDLRKIQSVVFDA